MTVDDVIAALVDRDAGLCAEAGQLKYAGPRLALDDPLRAGIAEHRVMLLELFTYAPEGRCVVDGCYRLKADDAVVCPGHEKGAPMSEHNDDNPLGVWVTGPPDAASRAQTGRGSSMGQDEVGRPGRPLSAVVAAVDDRMGTCAGWDGDQAAAGAGVADGSGQTRSSFPRLWARQASRYSPAARASPRRLRVVKPRASLSWPKTGSTMALRRA